MKTNIFILIIGIFLMVGCEENIEKAVLQETGTVIDYAGSGNCGFVIELDNGKSILPLSYPSDFIFAQGQEVWVEYNEIPDVNILCEKGAACEITRIEELGCTPYVDLYFSNYDSLARDPVYVQEIYVDGDCLHVKVSYSGGCEEHTVELARMNPWCATPPLPPPTFEIRHNSNGDMCEAWKTQEFRFDLSPLKSEGDTTFIVNALLIDGGIYHQTFDYKY